SRILGMGDIVTLVEKAEAAVDQETAERLEKRMLAAEFTFDDFLTSMEQLQKMGSLEEVMSMIPGMGANMKNMDLDEHELVKVRGIIQSMTAQERNHADIINPSRQKRIARGSGSSLQDVKKLLKNFKRIKRMFKDMKKMGKRGFGKEVFAWQ
ncbi:signal recognition particle protein, partial [Planctomycetota bacterium]